jgi:membrane-associated phospholipid phosphatase
MLDPLLGVALGVVGSLVAGPAVAAALKWLPAHRQKGAAWAVIVAAVLLAIVADLIAEGPVGGLVIYIIAVLPGLIAFLAFRMLVASAVVSLAPLYFVITSVTRDWPTHTPETAIDRVIGVVPAWMLVYGSLYVFIGALPLLVVRQRQLFRRALQSYLAVMLAGYAGFLLYPTAAPRPDVVTDAGFAAWSLRLAYALDPPYGCFPSLHVAYSFVSALTCYRVHRGVGVIAAGWAALIGVSTLYTKQHYAVDVLAGALVAFVAYGIFLRPYPRDSIADVDRRRAPLRAAIVIVLWSGAVALFWLGYRTGFIVP